MKVCKFIVRKEFPDFFSKIGWGYIKNVTDPIFLQNVQLDTISARQCYKYQYPDNPPGPDQLESIYCLGGTNGNETMCLGDSGGPAFWEDPNDTNRAFLIGIASSYLALEDQTCGEEPFIPGMFSRVNIDNTLKWLLSNAGTDLDDCLLKENFLKK